MGFVLSEMVALRFCLQGFFLSFSMPRTASFQNITVLESLAETNSETSWTNESKDTADFFDYQHVQVPFEITLWILLASLAKIGFHLFDKLPSVVPESCLLIVVGLIMGGIIFGLNDKSPPVMDSNVFFLYLLPPIVLDAGYFMPSRPFFENIGTILLYAVVGTIWNVFGIGFSLYVICQAEAFHLGDISLLHNLLFSSLIAAVDPVAVLSVFEEIHVNEKLHILVFGESLLNDAVAVVLYRLFQSFCEMPTIRSADVFLGIGKFFLVGIGGLLVGLLYAVTAAFTTRFTKNILVIEPLFVFLYSYLSYLTAEMFHLSGIVAIISCALGMKRYVEANISLKSHTTIKYFMKMWSSVSDTLIFIFLGVSTIGDNHEWNWPYICFTLIFCLLWRALGVLVLTFIINRLHINAVTRKDQFIIAYGGLRGAICFSLVVLLPDFQRKKLFIAATTVVIFFTVFVQGMTIRPLVGWLHVTRKQESGPTVGEQIHIRFLDHLLAGIEDISGHWGQYYWKDKLEYFNSKHLQKYLLREYMQPKSSIVLLHEKLERKRAIELAEAGRLSWRPSRKALLNKDNPVTVTDDTESLSQDELSDIQKILEKNLYKTRRMVSAYNRYTLPREPEPVEQVKEMVILRHKSLQICLERSASGYLRKEEEDSSTGETDPKLNLHRSLTDKHSRKVSLLKPGRSKSIDFISLGCSDANQPGEGETEQPVISKENMKIKIVALLAAILGVLSIFLFLVAFGTDYWLLVTEKCGGFEVKNSNLSSEKDGKHVWKEGDQGILTFHHEGFFWRCWFFGEGYRESIWNFWFTSQAHPKHCMNAYLFPMPIVFGPHPHPSYDATAVYRGFWTALIVLAITASLVGVFLLVCGVPFVNARFYKVGGGFLIAAGSLFTLLIFMFVVWKEFAADLRKYILLERSERCPDDMPLSVYYGWSFMFAAAGIPLVLSSGLLFYLVGHTILKELE